MNVYVYGDNGWWSATPEQWASLVAAAVLDDQRVNLDKHLRRLKGRPSSVRVNPTGRPVFIHKDGCRVLTVQRWTEEDWEQELRRLSS